MRHRSLVVAVGLAGLFAAGTLTAGAASASSTYAPIAGSGSTWAASAVFQWIHDAHQVGVPVNYSANGSAAGRQDFATGQTDFAVTDLTYAQAGDANPARQFSYLPVTAGAVTFPYQVRVAGKLRRDIRLSGATLADIFRGKITNWNAPAITADNNGHRVVADLPITPVVRADGSATTYHLTDWFSTAFPARWRAFSTAGATAFFPSVSGRTVAVAGSAAVVTRVMASSANGAIGYVENSFAQAGNAPVAALQNASGHYLPPDAGNVSLSLLRARVTARGEADLGGVYDNADPRAYPLSYYAYGIVPTGADPGVTTAKRQSEVDFFGHALCDGQGGAGQLGYAALPLNLTRAGLRAVAQLGRADPDVDTHALALSQCNNPTIVHAPDGTARDVLDSTVPQPPACSAEGSGPCRP